MLLMNFGQVSAMPEAHSLNKTFNSKELEKLKTEQKYQYELISIPSNNFFSNLLNGLLDLINGIRPSSNTLNLFFLVILIIILLISILTIIFKAKYSENQNIDVAINAFSEKMGIPLQSTPEEQLNQALMANDYRSAFRWQFIIYLKKAHLSGYISLSPEKTNYDYVKEYSNKRGNKSFKKVCLVYDYIWFGHKNVDENKYKSLSVLFTITDDEVKY